MPPPKGRNGRIAPLLPRLDRSHEVQNPRVLPRQDPLAFIRAELIGEAEPVPLIGQRELSAIGVFVHDALIDPGNLTLEVTIDFAASRVRSFPSHACGVHEHHAGIQVWVTRRASDLADARSDRIGNAGKHALIKVDREKIGDVSKHERVGIDIDELIQR